MTLHYIDDLGQRQTLLDARECHEAHQRWFVTGIRKSDGMPVRIYRNRIVQPKPEGKHDTNSPIVPQ